MIALVEGAVRQKTPNEIALNILLAGMTLIFVLAVVSIPSFAAYAGGSIPVIVLVALFVTLIPTTIGALLSAIGIAGMDRLVRFNVLAMSGRAVEAAGDVDTLLLDKTGTITLGNRQATELIAMPGVSDQELADAAQLSSFPDETPEGRSIVVLVKEKYGLRGARDGADARALRPVHRADPDERRRRRRPRDPQGCGRRRRRLGQEPGRPRPARAAARRRDDRQGRRHASGRGRERPRAGPRPPQGHRQGRHPRALRRAAPDGHPHGDDHRRQRADRGRHRRRGRGRRLPGAGHARGQAQADPRGAGQGQAGRDVRRRHQRRPGPGPGRCRRRHEHRHHGRARGRQHGRPRQRSHQADRGRGHRQAAADDPRRAHHLLDRQRRRQVLRDHPGHVRRDLPAAAGAQRHGPGQPAECHPVGDHLQRADHHRADPAGPARRRATSR